MKPVHQTTFGEGKGNCFAACLASILELPVDEVPNVCLFDDWFQRARDFVRGFGFDLLYVRFKGEQRTEVFVDGYWIAGGKSPRGDFLHAVVCKGNTFAHDPHPDGTFLAGEVEDAILFTVSDPARRATE